MMKLPILCVWICAPWIIPSPSSTNLVSAEGEASSPRSEGLASAEARVACTNTLDSLCVELKLVRSGDASFTEPVCETSFDSQKRKWWSCKVSCSGYCMENSDEE